jgi:DNA/RNA-binding domain of Phe-tRNA-synthetase-like protein
LSPVTLTVDEHPLLELRAVELRFDAPLGELEPPRSLVALLAADAAAPLVRDEEVRGAVRKLLRHGGFKPSGRNKPASEYLVRAADSGHLGSINLAVDLGNVVSLHSGLPLSVVDLGRAKPPLRIGVAPEGSSFVFNAGGQVIKVDHLLGLSDADGPCANAVKDAQRTKTDEQTDAVLVLIWGTVAAPGRAQEAADWLSGLARAAGAHTVDVTPA